MKCKVCVGNDFLNSSLRENQSLVFDHGGDIEAVDWHQVHVRDALGGDGDVLREVVLGVDKENTGGPASPGCQTEKMVWVGGGELQVRDHVEIVLDELDTQRVSEAVHSLGGRDMRVVRRDLM